MKRILLLLVVLAATHTQAQEVKFSLYKGTVDGLPVTLFLKAEYNACTADAFYTAMYQYDKKSTWIQVSPVQNDKEQFVFVENRFTGIMMLQRAAKTFTGTWISPDTKRQLKVILKEVTLNATDKKTYEKKLEDLNYENNDC